MGWIVGLLGTVGSFLLIPIGFAVGVYIPLVITDTAYQIYNTIGMSNFARQLFGSTNGVGVNWHNGFSQFLLIALIIGAIACVVSVLCNVIANWTRTGIKKSVGFARIGYGVTSIIAVPILFMFSITITALIFNALSGNTSSSFISGSERAGFVAIMGSYSSKINDILANLTYNLNGTQTNWTDAMNQLMTLVKQIQTDAASQGMTGLQQACDKIIQDIASCQSDCTATAICTELNNLISIANGMTIGQRLSDMSGLQACYDSLYGSQQCYLNLIKDLDGIKQYSNAFTTGGTHDAFMKIFGGTLSDGSTKVNGFLAYVNYGGVDSPSTTNYIYSINNIFAEVTIQNPLDPSKNLFYTSALTQIFGGCSSSSNPLNNHYWTTGSWGMVQNTNWIGLDEFYQRANPLPSFTLAGMINSFVLGQSGVNADYNIWNLYGSAYSNFFTGHMERVVVGMLVANMMMGTMMAFAWYMVGRVFELIILWLGSIVVAFKDDGEGTQFRIIMKAVVNKTLSIIFIEFVFTITNVLINMGFMKALMNNAASSSTAWFNATDAAIMMATVILFCASYYMGNTLCTMILGEAGQLRSFGDQWQNISSTGRQQYGYGVQSKAQQGQQQMHGAIKEGGKSYSGMKKDYNSFKMQGGQGGMFRNKDFKSFRATGGKKGIPVKEK